MDFLLTISSMMRRNAYYVFDSRSREDTKHRSKCLWQNSWVNGGLSVLSKSVVKCVKKIFKMQLVRIYEDIVKLSIEFWSLEWVLCVRSWRVKSSPIPNHILHKSQISLIGIFHNQIQVWPKILRLLLVIVSQGSLKFGTASGSWNWLQTHVIFSSAKKILLAMNFLLIH